MGRLRAPERTLDEEDAGDGALHVPDGKEIGALTLAIRTSDTVKLERDRLAAQLAVYSVQRRRMVASARISDFEFLKDGTALWSIPALHRKTASLKRRRHGVTVGAHVVPLPAPAAAVVRRAVELAGKDATYLFPSTRARRKDKPSLHMSPETLTHLFAAMEGNKVSPHDIRRAFGTTYAKAAGLRLDDVKAILDHSEGVKSGDVTAEHYAFLQGTHNKWPIMRGWCAWVDAQIDDAR
jgi:integrase